MVVGFSHQKGSITLTSPHGDCHLNLWVGVVVIGEPTHSAQDTAGGNLTGELLARVLTEMVEGRCTLGVGRCGWGYRITILHGTVAQW